MKAKAGPKTYLVDVAPLSTTPLQGTLSYFSSEKLVPGGLVQVPVRNKLTPALVLSAKDVRSAKQDIRRAGFVLKKIRKSDLLEAALEPTVFAALSETARYYATSSGFLLSALLPKLILSDPETFLTPAITKKPPAKPSSSSPETILLQMESEERFGQYRALIRQSFARGRSVLFVVPTHLDAARVASELSLGIAEFVQVFTLSGKASLARAAWQAARAEPHPVLFITTPAGLFFPRPDIGMVVVERASSRAYRTLARPYIDLRRFITLLAKHSEWQLVLGDAILPIETLWREKNGEYGEMSLVRWRLPAAPARIVDSSLKQNDEGRFEIFSRELKELIAKALASRERIFLFGARKGLAPTTVCGDCGTVLPCLNCGAPLVLHRKNDATVYQCHACGSVRESIVLCGTCKGWKLVPLGIGTEEIARQAALLFPGYPVAILDKDHAPNDAKARSIAKKFAAEGGILVGTELAFFHLDPVPYSGLVSVDALFSVPDFHINERIFYLVSRLRELTRTEAVIQTRNIGRQLLAWATQGNIIDFYQNEIAEREALLYPPFSIFVTIEAPSRHLVQNLLEHFLKWHPDVLRRSIVMRVPRATWPDKELSKELALLGPEFSIRVDPESIL